MRRRWLVSLAVLLALLGAAAGLAMSPSARRSMSRARTDADRQLAAVRFPDGARKIRHDPSVRGLHKAGRFCVKSYTAWVHGFWQVPETPESLFRWIQKNPPLHTHGFDATWSKKNGKAVAWDITVPFPDQTNVHGQTVDIQLGLARGGGTAVRVDSEAFVNPPRNLIPKRCKVGAAY
jgi:hypothetical protein